MKKLKSELSVSGINNLINELESYKREIIEKTKLIPETMAKEGVEIAKKKITEFDAIESGALLNSVTAVKSGDGWAVQTNCEWAGYVEFGTGIVGKNNFHVLASKLGWEYDVNNHGIAGWWYVKDGKRYWTRGMISRPFMFETSLELQLLAPHIVKMIFKR